ncbi:hypothetical protein [Leifsonia sp. EB41]|uniref:hypothetical protein n=1 Tax=Leifsonia sp. EB41 TaxID=3156260 RepID=UPI0035128DD2
MGTAGRGVLSRVAKSDQVRIAAIVAAAVVAVTLCVQPFSVPPVHADQAAQASDASALPQHVTNAATPGSPLTNAGVRQVGELPSAPGKPNGLAGEASGAAFDPNTSTVSSRSQFETVFQNTDGSKTAQFSTVPLNVQKSDGSWATVNTQVTKDSSGDLTVGNHPLSPKFAADSGSSAGDYQVTSDDHTVSFNLVGEKAEPAGQATAAQREITGGGAASSVAYDNVASNTDLTYQVTPGQVKETLILNAKPSSANPSYAWNVHAPGLILAQDSLGDITFTDDVTGKVVFVTPVPAMMDSSAVAGQSSAAIKNVPVTLTQTSTVDWQMTLTPDPAWLDDPARVYPVHLDPSLASNYANDTHSFENNGTVLSGVAYVGNSRAGGDTMWRTVTHIPYEQLFGYQVLTADLQESYAGDGTTNSTIGMVDIATGQSYGSVGTALSPITISAGTSGYGDATGGGLASTLASWVNAGSANNYFMLGGQETAGAYTYKSLGLEMFVNYEAKPTAGCSQVSVPDPNGFRPYDIVAGVRGHRIAHARSGDADVPCHLHAGRWQRGSGRQLQLRHLQLTVTVRVPVVDDRVDLVTAGADAGGDPATECAVLLADRGTRRVGDRGGLTALRVLHVVQSGAERRDDHTSEQLDRGHNHTETLCPSGCVHERELVFEVCVPDRDRHRRHHRAGDLVTGADHPGLQRDAELDCAAEHPHRRHCVQLDIAGQRRLRRLDTLRATCHREPAGDQSRAGADRHGGSGQREPRQRQRLHLDLDPDREHRRWPDGVPADLQLAAGHQRRPDRALLEPHRIPLHLLLHHPPAGLADRAGAH